jgi:hypothetical protein
MKIGRSLTELAAEIERQAHAKRDLLAPTSMIALAAGANDVEMRVGDNAFGINSNAHGQLATYTKVPRDYYDRMRAEAPALLASNVNHWLHREQETRMVRTLDGHVRALLSDRYRPLENIDLASAVLPILADLRMDIVSAEITEARFYLKVVNHAVQRDIERVRPGAYMGDGGHTVFDTCVPAMTIRNSEVGAGALVVESGMLTKACTNLAFFSDAGMKRRHVGARHELLEAGDFTELLSDRTKKLTDAALWSQLSDVVRNAFDEKRFEARVEKVAATTKQRIEGDPVKSIEFVRRKFGMTEGEGKGILRHLIEGGDLSRYGVFNATTRAAEDCESYDRASEIERVGGMIIDLAPSEWKRISLAEGDPMRVALAA